VTKIGSNQLKWTFSTTATSDGSASPQLEDLALGGSSQPTATVQNGATAVTATYSGLINIGDSWRIGATPTHITFASGATLATPVTGLVT
jgi:hypothetical protein